MEREREREHLSYTLLANFSYTTQCYCEGLKNYFPPSHFLSSSSSYYTNAHLGLALKNEPKNGVGS